MWLCVLHKTILARANHLHHYQTIKVVFATHVGDLLRPAPTVGSGTAGG